MRGETGMASAGSRVLRLFTAGRMTECAAGECSMQKKIFAEIFWGSWLIASQI
jgi:hypothetical protein